MIIDSIAPLLIVPAPPDPLDVHVPVPAPADNLFERLIRDPQALHRPMREGQCTEMLRAVLIACPTLQVAVLKRLAGMCGVPQHLVEDLHWMMETEQSIGSKRDDLRMEGWRDSEGGSQRVVLWTVEVKVAAPIHASSLQKWDADAAAQVRDDEEMVSQLVNYDHWLRYQEAEYRAGFVLAVRDVSDDVPTGLNQRWCCVRWTDIALETQRCLSCELLPPAERPLASQMLGFIHHRLWDTTDMSNARLELNDVALLQALAVIGPSCQAKLKGLVSQFKEVFEETGVPFKAIKTSSSFFDRTDVVQHAIRAECTSAPDKSWLAVAAGIVGDEVRVWISCNNPTATQMRQKVRRLLQDHQVELQERNPRWVIADAEAPGPVDAEIARPLTSVLAVEDWQSPLIDFVRDAVEGLQAVGVLDALVSMNGGERAERPAGSESS